MSDRTRPCRIDPALLGRVFTNLTVVGFATLPNSPGQWRCECRCVCGSTSLRRPSNLCNGNDQSCGCRQYVRGRRRKRSDLVGGQFGRLVVVSAGEDKFRCDGTMAAQWLCRCDCGGTILTTRQNLKNGGTRSCGCIRLEALSRLPAINTVHGECGTRLHQIWMAMKDRCLNPRCKSYANYGGRGIDIDPRWVASYTAFRDDVGYPEDGMSLDRQDNSRGYWPTNVKWATPAVQSRNKRSNRWFVYSGVRMVLTDWLSPLGVDYTIFRRHLARVGPDRVISSLLNRKMNRRSQPIDYTALAALGIYPDGRPPGSPASTPPAAASGGGVGCGGSGDAVQDVGVVAAGLGEVPGRDPGG